MKKNKSNRKVSDIVIRQLKLRTNAMHLQQTLKIHQQLLVARKKLLFMKEYKKLISGGSDQHIGIWKCWDDESWSIVDILKNIIIIMELEKKEWVIFQQIKCPMVYTSDKQQLCSFCFITDDQFAFYSSKLQSIQIFSLGKKLRQFNKVTEVQCPESSGDNLQNQFQMKFLKQKQLLFYKYGTCINIISKRDKTELKPEESLDFKNDEIQGTITDDEHYLVTLDNLSKNIEFRKLSV